MTLFVWNWQPDLNYPMLFGSLKQLRRGFVLRDAQTLALQAELPILSHLCHNLRGAPGVTSQATGLGSFGEASGRGCCLVGPGWIPRKEPCCAP